MFPLRALGPAIPRPPRAEILRACAGTALGLGLAAAVERVFGLGPALLPPLGATAVLVMAVPNSPLAQPWSTVVGSAVAAAVAVPVALLLPAPLAAPAAVALALAGMAMLRAMHPPAGAIALMTALAVQGGQSAGAMAAPLAAGTLTLIVAGMIWAALTGRHYPMRVSPSPALPSTTLPSPALPPAALPPAAARAAAPPPDARPSDAPLPGASPAAEGPALPRPDATPDGPPRAPVHAPARAAAFAPAPLSEAELTALLARFRQSTNIAPADLGRLLSAAQAEAARHRFAGTTCGDVMSAPPVSVPPEAPLDAVAAALAGHGIKSLPVVDAKGRLAGMLHPPEVLAALTRPGGPAPRASDLMRTGTLQVAADLPVALLLHHLAASGPQAVAVTAPEDRADDDPANRPGGRLLGVITRTDMLALLLAEQEAAQPQDG